MELDKLKDYKVLESEVITDADTKHIDNYKQLIKFFENAIHSSIKEGNVNYNALHASCIQCIRYLDNLVYTYDNALQSARLLNTTLDKIIDDHKKKKSSGNGQENQSQL